MMAYSRRPRKKSTLKRWLLAIVPLLVIGGTIYWLALGGNRAEAPADDQTDSVQQSAPEQYAAPDLQPVIDSWLGKYPADYHIAVYDHKAGRLIAEAGADESLFAASLYKLYVAYLSLVDFQSGAQNPDDVLIAGQTKKECVDKMIRSSDSPCGEAMMAEIGQTVLNQRVEAMGMTGTFFDGIQTSARDSALLLQYILDRRDLNDENTDFLMDAMRDQPDMYERGLKAGAPEGVWFTKVGWNLDVNYHDVGILRLSDGRQFAVAILGQGSGSPAPIADFSKTVYEALTR